MPNTENKNLDENHEELQKNSIFYRMYNLLKFTPQRAWENLFIVLSGVIIATFLGEYYGIINFMIGIEGALSDSSTLIGGCFFIIIGIIELYLIKKIPLKLMRRNVLVFAIIVSFAFATGIMCYWNIVFAAITILFWIGFYIYAQLYDNSLSITGLFGLLIFMLISTAAPDFGFVAYPIETVILYGVFGFSIVILCSIPMFIVRLIQKDPAKREYIAKLFDKNVQFHEFIETKEAIVDFDNSDRNRSLISIAKDIFIANNNLKTLSKYIENDKDYELFIKEIERLLDKVKVAIEKGFDDGFEVNLGYVTEYQKNLEFSLKTYEIKDADLRLLNLTITSYKRLFEDLNKVLANELVIDTISPQKRHNRFLEILQDFNLSNIRLRFSIRSIVALVLSLLADLFVVHSPLDLTTLISAFTIQPTSSNTNKDIMIRFICTIAGVTAGIILSSIFKDFGWYVLLGLADLICFILFFIFKENEQVSLIFVMMAFLFMNYTEPALVSLEHMLITIISMLIIIVISNFILPNDEESNVVKLIKEKFELISNFTEVALSEDNKDAVKILQKLSNNNHDIMRLFSNLNDTYDNICQDIHILTELNSALIDYASTITAIRRYAPTYDFSEFSRIMVQSLDYNLARLNGDENLEEVDEEEFLRVFSVVGQEDSEIHFLLPSFSNIIKDLMYINDLVNRGIDSSIFELYDQDILEDNLRDKITWRNFKYLLKQYRYIFVAARYLYNISGEDIKNVVKEGESKIESAYDATVKKAYDATEEQIRDIYRASSENMAEITEYGRTNINKLYTTTGEVIEIPKEEVKKIFSFSWSNLKFAYAFVQGLFKHLFKNRFRNELDKEKALKKKQEADKKKILGINLFF